MYGNNDLKLPFVDCALGNTVHLLFLHLTKIIHVLNKQGINDFLLSIRHSGMVIRDRLTDSDLNPRGFVSCSSKFPKTNRCLMVQLFSDRQNS